MESIKTTINHITAAKYTYANSTETGAILHDLDSDCACLVTNSDPIWYDSMAALADDIREDAKNYGIGVPFATLAAYIHYYYDVDVMACTDDAAALDILGNTIGTGATAWIKDIAANA